MSFYWTTVAGIPWGTIQGDRICKESLGLGGSWNLKLTAWRLDFLVRTWLEPLFTHLKVLLKMTCERRRVSHVLFYARCHKPRSEQVQMQVYDNSID